jgi:hypothetical protein
MFKGGGRFRLTDETLLAFGALECLSSQQFDRNCSTQTWIFGKENNTRASFS